MIILQTKIQRKEGGFEVTMETLRGEDWNKHEKELADYLRDIIRRSAPVKESE